MTRSPPPTAQQSPAAPHTRPTTVSEGGEKTGKKRGYGDYKSLARAYLYVKHNKFPASGRGAETRFEAVKRLLRCTDSDKYLQGVLHDWKTKRPAEWRRELAKMKKDPEVFREIVSISIQLVKEAHSI